MISPWFNQLVWFESPAWPPTDAHSLGFEGRVGTNKVKSHGGSGRGSGRGVLWRGTNCVSALQWEGAGLTWYRETTDCLGLTQAGPCRRVL